MESEKLRLNDEAIKVFINTKGSVGDVTEELFLSGMKNAEYKLP